MKDDHQEESKEEDNHELEDSNAQLDVEKISILEQSDYQS